ncbi:hypothetical protein GJ496_007019 [Pomphorhynchus laevis]|nr:hypothetical protein GJ496_007019 [Pomphorhynchus laevis]
MNNINRNYNPTEKQIADYLDNLITKKLMRIDYSIGLLMFDLINNSALPQVLCLHSICVPRNQIDSLTHNQSIEFVI